MSHTTRQEAKALLKQVSLIFDFCVVAVFFVTFFLRRFHILIMLFDEFLISNRCIGYLLTD